MIEIRPIKSDEASAFLSILVECFGLDPARAKQAFHSDPLFDINRKWALFDGGDIRSILTVTPLLFGWGRAIGIAGVATLPAHRGLRYGERLLQEVLRSAERAFEAPSLLFAHRPELYERVGFHVMDEVVSAEIAASENTSINHPMPLPEIKAIYSKWSEAHPERLQRDEARWRYWNWFHRPCERWGDGYVCLEHQLCREVVLVPGGPSWPVGRNTKWLGLGHMADQLQVPIGHRAHEMYLMGRGFPGRPQMFLTDQF
ncbi:MAG: GNAT family N-acetyltransferase [Fimbriimonadaceae bacterium]|nr:GNAT family N-acetyltransferase [Fimbriimonadaceae bacterium]